MENHRLRRVFTIYAQRLSGSYFPVSNRRGGALVPRLVRDGDDLTSLLPYPFKAISVP